MPTFDLSPLRAGDIVLFKWIDGGWHTALSSGNGRIVHCVNEQTGTTEDAITNHTNTASEIYAFRTKLPDVEPGAIVTTARGWIKTVSKGPSLPGYDSARGSAVLSRFGFDQKQHTDGPPFGYDALFRVVKWATRIDGAFTRKRGTTCCAFVIAAWQATLLRAAVFDNKDLLVQCHEYLLKRRDMAAKPHDKLAVKERSRIGVSNVGPVAELRKPPDTTGSKDEKPDWRKLEELPVEIVWITVLTELGADWVLATPENSEGKWLRTVFGAALFCDAKFTYSNTLYTRLVADQGAWEQVVIPKK